jgi:hypothetical protein
MNRPVRGYDYDDGTKLVSAFLIIGITIGFGAAMAVVSYKELEEVKSHPVQSQPMSYECVLVKKEQK